MKILTTAALTATVAVLSGCAVYPAGGTYYDDPGYYRSAPPVYYEPGPVYGAPPVYYGPGPVIIDRGNWDRDRRGDRDRYNRGNGGRDWRDGHDGRPPRVEGGRPPPPVAQPAPRPPQGDFGRQPDTRPGSSQRYQGRPELRGND